ncbi:MAG: tRNA (guanosine(46)-N7)-methyltransferase TrmB [Flavobacteriales bacterium]|nr:tRNA (guanosine(46)-N7)-methyltransferase TrmB [Flavobacteriales bacterium]
MGSNKNKLKRFKEMKSFDNVFEPDLETIKTDNYVLKGNWRKDYFKNDNPIVLELGCGKGEYTVGMGKKFPNKNFIAVDIKGARMYIGSKQALEDEMDNVAFLRTRIEFIESFFEQDEVDEIWITFPDPQPQERRIKKRLTSPLFLDRYSKFLKRDGIVHLKTDSSMLHKYTLEVVKERGHNLIDSSADLYAGKISEYDAETQEILGIKTHYELLFSEKGCKITYLKFRMN